MTSHRTDQNHFNHLRLVASYTVVISHAFVIRGLAEPLQATGFYNTLGGMAVYVFFVMSGYLISQSFARSKSLSSYFIKRALRIVPGLYFVLGVTVLLIGPAVSELGAHAYFLNPEMHRYLLKNLLFWCRPADQLPGVFTHHANTSANGSLWTLPYEAIAYITLPLVAVIRKPISAKFVMVILCLLFVLAFLPWQEFLPVQNLLAQKSDPIRVSAGFFYYFYAGVLLNFLPTIYFRPSMMALLGGMTLGFLLAGIGKPLLPIMFAIALPYCVIYFATRPAQPSKFNRLIETHDLSYGIYVWGFLLEQLLVQQKSLTNIYAYIAASLLVTTAVAFISWTLVERPALRLKDKTT